MSRKNRNEKIKLALSSQEIAKEVRHRSRILFGRHKTAGHVIESRKYKPTKHRRREELSWVEE
jgi:hypothetical protein